MKLKTEVVKTFSTFQVFMQKKVECILGIPMRHFPFQRS